MGYPTEVTGSAPIAPPAFNSRLSFEDMLDKMNVDKQEFEQPEGFASREPVPMPGVRKILTPEEEANISLDSANEAGEQLAGLVANGSGTLCSMIGGEYTSKYSISASKRNDLKKSYSRVALHYGFGGANPLFEAVLLTLIILFPLFKSAFEDRKIKKVREEQERQAQEQIRLKARQNQMQAELEALKTEKEINNLKIVKDAAGNSESQ